MQRPRPIMSATEAVAAMRAVGYPMSTTRLIDGIISGLFPFGYVVSMGGDGPHPKRTVRIFRAKFEPWLAGLLIYDAEMPGEEDD